MDSFLHVAPALGAAIASISAMIAVFGVIIAARNFRLASLALKANHDWNRRQYAGNMVVQWNEQTLAHRKAIEAAFPGLIDKDRHKPYFVELTKAKALEIYLSKAESEDFKLRFHLIELLNYFEFVATAYMNGVADEKIIEDSFKNAMVRWYEAIENFMEVNRHHRGFESWKPYVDIVELWNPKKGSGARAPTDDPAATINPQSNQ